MIALLAPTLAFTLHGSPQPVLARRGGVAAMQFGNPLEGIKNPFADKNDGATTLTLTMGFRCPDRGPKSILGQLDTMAANADTSCAEGIAALCGDVSLALLRRSNEYVSCCGTAEHKGDDEDALTMFDRLAIKEAAKFDDRDSSATVDAALAAAGLPGGAAGAAPTLAVVCIVACVMGDREEELTGKDRKDFQGDAIAMKRALQELATSAQGDNEIFAFELFWVPGEDSETLEQDEIYLDWPELMAC